MLPPWRLTNTMYKVYASLIQTKTCHQFSQQAASHSIWLSSRPLSHPVLRRLLEVHERQTEPFHAIFLDWAVTFSATAAALAYMGVPPPPPLQQAILSLYPNPSFVVRDSEQSSSKSAQTRGLRQGCPLSPHLFSLVLTHLRCGKKKTLTA